MNPAARLALIYLGFSVLWILLSDELVAQIAGHDGRTLQKLQSAKGITFVLCSGLLLYLTARKIYKSLQVVERGRYVPAYILSTQYG